LELSPFLYWSYLPFFIYKKGDNSNIKKGDNPNKKREITPIYKKGDNSNKKREITPI
jgi:hypothetical protein